MPERIKLKNLRKRVPLSASGIASKTQQQYKASSNVNNIMKTGLKTGLVMRSDKPPFYLNNPNLSSMDFLETQNLVIDAKRRFEALPSKIRKQFDHSPYELLRFMENPENKEEAIRLGLVAPDKPPVDPNQTDLLKSDPEANPMKKPPAEGA